MATVRMPLFSLSASDSLGKALTFSRWKGRAYVRTLVKPRNPQSGIQVGMRAAFRFSAQKYRNLNATQQANWKVASRIKNVTPQNAMIRFNQIRVRQGLGVAADPTLTPGAAEAAPTGVTIGVQAKSLLITWVDSVGAGDFCTFIYMSTSTGFTPAPANLIAVIAHGVQTYTKTKLTTGTTYYFVLRGDENGGTLGTAAAQVSGVPT